MLLPTNARDKPKIPTGQPPMTKTYNPHPHTRPPTLHSQNYKKTGKQANIQTQIANQALRQHRIQKQ